MLIEIILLLLGIPTGYILAYLARDELIAGRKWFKAIIIASFLTGIWFYFAGQNFIAYTTAFILISTFISLTKSYDKKWTKRRI